MKKILKSLGLLALVAAMIYSSLSLMLKKVSADGVQCCSVFQSCPLGYKCDPYIDVLQ